jgi:hypothetical protein
MYVRSAHPFGTEDGPRNLQHPSRRGNPSPYVASVSHVDLCSRPAYWCSTDLATATACCSNRAVCRLAATCPQAGGRNLAHPDRAAGGVSDEAPRMIGGVVNARHAAIVRLRGRGPGGKELDVVAMIDSGFTASLTLPATIAATLGLIRQSGGGADKTRVPFFRESPKSRRRTHLRDGLHSRAL